ncbi:MULTISPECIES: IclR family transcriptional regulator [unclassified Chelatococcus]|uniref:IclR family transcriptional regulator n=1 Tax=unclassified Chelatococcus TaxID=2638111 RepID=UPI001BCC802C|nr:MULTISPECIES: IclR family transcriptional regulator [unclassified Chelatococcus]MBS7699978.1 IclR family transcriptional regulator [Chelatococcus sp. YT9]MBX3558597.1 IclR family transcriptional regulator [Chelatococcus sp.]
MAASLLDRALNTLELMSTRLGGVSVTQVADEIGLPKSGAHRLLTELIRLGYVRQDTETERYHLTTRLISIGLAYLSASGITDISQPILDRLAEESGELVRMTVVDGDHLTWVAKAQGARSGLRYDPEMGGHPVLFCTATGQAWLASFSDDEAIARVARQGFGKLDEHGPNAPRTISALVEALVRTRSKGYAYVDQAAEAGTSALSAAVLHPRTGVAIGTVSIAGPSARLTPDHAVRLAPLLLAAAKELSATSAGSELFTDKALARAG